MAADEQSFFTTDLAFIVGNCVTKNPDENKDMYYFELVEGSEKVLDLPKPEEPLRISLNK